MFYFFLVVFTLYLCFRYFYNNIVIIIHYYKCFLIDIVISVLLYINIYIYIYIYIYIENHTLSIK